MPECRLVVVLPAADADKPRFRLWRVENYSGATVTKSLGFQDEDVAMVFGRALPYPIWCLETSWRPSL